MRRLSLLNRQPFEASIAFAALLGCVVFLVDPGPIRLTAVGHTARSLLPFWEALYGLGGVLILLGLLTLSIRFEVTGLIVFSAALVINVIAVVHFAGVEGAATAATFAGLGMAAISRTLFLLKGWRQARELR